MREIKQSMRKAGTALLSAFFVLPSLAQEPDNVTLELNRVSLVQALQQLKSQTHVRFVYSDEELRNAPPVTLSVADLYWTGHADDRYFVFDSRSPHRIEVGASWVVSEKVPVTLSWYTVLFGAADVNHKGERAYASYFEAACPFTVKTVDMKAGVGMVPWNAAATYLTGDRGFCVQNVFLNAGKSWTIKGTDSMSVGVFTNLIWNPALDDVNFVGGISFRM